MKKCSVVRTAHAVLLVEDRACRENGPRGEVRGRAVSVGEVKLTVRARIRPKCRLDEVQHRIRPPGSGHRTHARVANT